MEIFLILPVYYLIFIFIIVIIIPWVIFSSFVKKEWYDFTIWKGIFEIFIAKITCSLIWSILWALLFSIFIFLLSFIWIKNSILENSVLLFFYVWAYFFFYYKFLNSTLWFFIFNENIRKQILLKFIFISEIISSLLFSYVTISLFLKYANSLWINLF